MTFVNIGARSNLCHHRQGPHYRAFPLTRHCPTGLSTKGARR